MKSPDPVTIYDLECTAKDAKNGVAEYKGVKVYWDDAIKEFIYYVDNMQFGKLVTDTVLEIRNHNRN